ncbi:hypothetical protein C6P46_000896 [Rhodotorula mucilaginosa]|uniref:GATA-type domain-containing protein n=1 Tax=Rhodotorula mucilaginosa TaxID=5537 RepID=A0A9P7B7P7_RHOMI|nr:hypothetical protein C6P46_000896 [Rhodotorula mucilaginosa]
MLSPQHGHEQARVPTTEPSSAPSSASAAAANTTMQASTSATAAPAPAPYSNQRLPSIAHLTAPSGTQPPPIRLGPSPVPGANSNSFPRLAGWSTATGSRSPAGQYSDREASSSTAADADAAAILSSLPRAKSHSPPLAADQNSGAPSNAIPYYNGRSTDAFSRASLSPREEGRRPLATDPPRADEVKAHELAGSPAPAAASGSGKREKSINVCSSCGTTTTPLWRRDPQGKTICNACGLYLKNRRQPKSLDPTPSAGTPSAGLTGGVGAPGPSAASGTHRPVTPSTVSALSHWTQLAAAAGQHLHEAVAASSNARGHVTPHGPGSPRAATPFPSEKNVGHLALPELPSLPTPPIVSTEGSPAAAAAVASRDNADPPAGSCPGGGVCNGSGGQTCCQGCPALNNRVMYRTGPGGNAHKKGKKRAESEAAAQSGGGGGGGTAKGSLASASKSSIGASLQLQSGNGSGRMAKVASTGAAERDGAMGAAEGGEASNVGVMECHNCGTRLYYKLHGQHRPVNLKKPVIKRRKRVPAAAPGQNRAAMMEAHARASNGASDTASPPPTAQDGADSTHDGDSVASSSTAPPPSKRRKTASKKAMAIAAATASPGPQVEEDREAAAGSALQGSPRNTLSELAAIATHTAQQQQHHTQKPHTHPIPAAASNSSALTTGVALQPSAPHTHAPHSSHAHHHHHHAVPHTHAPHSHIHTHMPPRPHRHVSATPLAVPSAANLDTPLNAANLTLRDLASLRDSLREEIAGAREHMTRLDAFVRRGDGIVRLLDEAVQRASSPQVDSASRDTTTAVQSSSRTGAAPPAEDDDYEAYLRSLPAAEAVKLPLRPAATNTLSHAPTGAEIKREGSTQTAPNALALSTGAAAAP